MYLKSIEVQGFKSFAHKLVFEFHDGITGIVGPNGSGKSNVADAVRWVLGEQSAKQLRGARMEDIIFSGTETRKPLSFAYVAITLNNADHKIAMPYEEVTVARRVYRSGESEYLINGVSSRLKDVHELFFDTGIGKEGYSIIGQGQIDRILSGKPEERRELFDEAAGIVKFKKRKATAEKSLEAEKQNLLRVSDILTELEKQLGPLEKQSEIAREYLKLRDTLKIHDINIFLVEYTRMQEELKEVLEKQTITQNELAQTNQEYDHTKKEYEILEQRVEEYNLSLEEKKGVLSDSKVKLEQLDGEVKVYQEQIVTARQNEQHFKERMDSVNLMMEHALLDMDKYLLQKNENEAMINAMDDKQSEFDQALTSILEQIGQLEKEVASCNSEMLEILNTSTNIKTEKQKCETMLEQNAIKKAELNQQLFHNKSECEYSIQAMAEEEDKLKTIREKKEVVDCNKIDLTKEVIRLEQEYSNLDQEYQEKQRYFHMENSKLNSLKNITERYEGFGQSIRRVMEQKEHIPGIVGVVADIITVNKEYETAVEIALGGSIQNIVTENETTAKELIEFLKKNKYGRATFLPLTNISSKSSYKQELSKEVGVIGPVSSLVKMEEKYKGLVEYLLGRFVLVDHMTNAIPLSKKYHHTLRIVTLEGELLNPGGSMSGGAYRNSSNLLGRRREMEDIGEAVKLLTTQLQEVQMGIQKNKQEKNHITTEIEKIDAESQLLQIEANTGIIKYEQAVKDKEGKEKEFQFILQNGLEIEKQRMILQESLNRITDKLVENEHKNKENEGKSIQFNLLLEEKKQEERQSRENVSSFQLELSSLSQNNQYILEHIDRVNMDIEKAKEEQADLLQNEGRVAIQVNEKETAIQQVQAVITDIRVSMEALVKEIEKETRDKEVVVQSQKGFFVKREELSKHMNELDKECFRLTNQLDKLKEQIDDQINYMWSEYEVTYHLAIDMGVESELSLSQMKKEIGEIKSKIRALGVVNVNAMEDYNNLTERYVHLKTQHDDLVKAEDILRGIILELDEEMRKQFSEKFKEIREQFDTVFKELFGGGKGTLELMEEEDILEAGIKIIAQPPGKKLQNMMQLSGGEKALTAIALLFAIQNLKPSPFCLLDEIEAALDDSNVKKFAKYLHKLTKNTQFIVITHRQGTMAAADALYGITMQEKGVSTLVSVNLIEDQLKEQEA